MKDVKENKLLLKNKDEISLLEKLEQCVKDKYGTILVCSGCAHSVGGKEPFPGKPSGERPCFFCIRNSERELWQEEYIKNNFNKDKNRLETWYDGSKPIKVPMDCYHSVDITEQMSVWWSKRDKEKGAKIGDDSGIDQTSK